MSWRVRFTACATGTRAAAPAEVFQALAVIPAERRSGTSTPWAPNPAAERTTAPRLRGSVTESSATISGASWLAVAAWSRSSGWAYSYGGTRAARPWWTAPAVIRSSSARGTSSREMPRSAAVANASLRRPSRSAPSATYIAVTGSPARSASTTLLRPATHSESPPWFGRRLGFAEAARSWRAFFLWAWW